MDATSTVGTESTVPSEPGTPPVCPWYCRVCRGHHDNACPTLWGGDFVPGRCGHGVGAAGQDGAVTDQPDARQAPVTRGPARVDLGLSVMTIHSGGTSRRTFHIADGLRPRNGFSGCGRHYPAHPSKRQRDAGYPHLHLDCPCDVACPRCSAPVGDGCRTLDGGGISGGGYPTKTHAARVKVSPRCQALLTGERTPCDLGDHDWVPDVDAEHLPDSDAAGLARTGFDVTDPDIEAHEAAWFAATHATCRRCERTEPLHENRPRGLYGR